VVFFLSVLFCLNNTRERPATRAPATTDRQRRRKTKQKLRAEVAECFSAKGTQTAFGTTRGRVETGRARDMPTGYQNGKLIDTGFAHFAGQHGQLFLALGDLGGPLEHAPNSRAHMFLTQLNGLVRHGLVW